MNRPQNALERQAQLLAHLLNDAIVGLLGILILLIAIGVVLVWSAGQPEVSAFLPQWLAPSPASVVTLPEGGYR